MGDLLTLKLTSVYDSSEYHLVDDLMVPLLSQSIEYCRGVGYFSSGWLRMAAHGLSDLVSAGGRARLIMSPILEEKDWQAIVIGQHARENDLLRQRLHEAVGEIAESLEQQTLNAFAWMIADNLIDIRFAVPRPGYSGGDYHDKVAYFRDSKNNCVAIHGSYNDSVKGTLNGEAFSVFKSWDAGHRPFIEQHVSRLDRLWNDENPQFHAFRLPEAVREQIVQLRSTHNRPYSLSSESGINLLPAAPCIPKDIKLHDYQNQAIDAWKKNNCQGIFEMATGTGKTYTALGAAVAEQHVRRKLATVILVPYIHLLDQWAKDCEAFGYKPILCGSSQLNWKTTLRAAITDFRLTKSNICVIAVHQTASSEPFLRAFSTISEDQKMLIADEVHGLGARQLRGALQDGFKLRLGLSATPRRWYDEEGTKILFDYFKDVCFEFTLKDAIGRKFLVPYFYRPQLVRLTEEECKQVECLSVVIGRLSGKKSASGLDEQEQACLEKALRDRALVVKKAENKLKILTTLLRALKKQGSGLEYSLFYSPESQHKQVLRALKEEGILAHQFTGNESASTRKRILRQFADGHISSLVAMKCLDEGVDVPATKNAFFLASTTNPKEFIQRRGRILRRSANKDRAEIYDFIVVPDEGTALSVATYLLEREMPRFAEFSDLAENGFAARSILRPILDQYQMLHLLDMKPWDVYQRQNPQVRDDPQE